MSNKTGSIFVTNARFNFFVVEEKINTEKLKNCLVHESLEAMYEYVMDKCKLALDEVQSIEFRILNGYYSDDAGNRNEIEGDIEKFISEYHL
jgi:hypothetical protein